MSVIYCKRPESQLTYRASGVSSFGLLYGHRRIGTFIPYLLHTPGNASRDTTYIIRATLSQAMQKLIPHLPTGHAFGVVGSYLPSMPITLLDVGLTLLGLFVLRVLYTWMKQRAPLPPGPKGLPLVGNIFDMPASHEWYKFAEWSQYYGTPLRVPRLTL
jgi:hypothetical protein